MVAASHPSPSRWLLTLLLHHKMEEERDTLLRAAPGDLVLVPTQQSQQANVVTQQGGRGLFLWRGPVSKTGLGRGHLCCPGLQLPRVLCCFWEAPASGTSQEPRPSLGDTSPLCSTSRLERGLLPLRVRGVGACLLLLPLGTHAHRHMLPVGHHTPVPVPAHTCAHSYLFLLGSF